MCARLRADNPKDVPTPSQLLDVLLLPAFLLVLTTWLAASIALLVGGLTAGRRALDLARARRIVEAIQSQALDHDAERTAMAATVATLPEGVLLALGANPPGSGPQAQRVAEAVLARLGRDVVEHAAAGPANPRYNARRVAALQLLAHAQAPDLVPLLVRLVDDRETEIVGASLAVLGKLPDLRAAEVLVDALKEGKYTASRIATYLDLFPLPIGQLLRPLLHHPDPSVRYWGATLLARHPVPGVEADLAALTRDAAPLVRKAAITSLAEIDAATAASAARALLRDDTWYVRAHAVRALAQSAGVDAAEEIAPLLADREWWVRLAAKESLQSLGDEVWSVLVPYLDHEDGFARNGAAEVLQNIGVLDSLIVLEAATARPSPAKIEMLRKIASAGGARMTAALLDRVDARTRPRVKALLETLGLEPAGVES